jgi:thioredoxin reductase (NADPH)
MGKPVILAVDDDISVLEAVVQDLRRQYGSRYRVLRAGSGQAALDLCAQLQTRGDSIALFLSDQRMPGMSGVDFLAKTIEQFPETMRALLTAYADTEAAIRAINTAKIHYYLTKPWDPPEEKLYPVLDELLEFWNGRNKPGFDGLRVIGTRFGAKDHDLRDFLTKNNVPYQWLDPARTSDAEDLLRARGLSAASLPVVLFGDGTSLVQPDRTQLAARVGMRTEARNQFYDLIVVGGGPSGLAAAVYGGSEGLCTLLIEANAPGGQAGSSSRIENYLGFDAGISGANLADRAFRQATRFGTEFLTQRVTGFRSEGGYHHVCLSDGREVSSLVCLMSMGVEYRRMDVPGVDRLTGAGVYYGAALAEAKSCQDENVFIVGGANSAGQGAMYFSKYAAKVTMLVRGKSLESSMSKYLIDQIAGTSNIEVLVESQVVEACGETQLDAVRYRTPGGERVEKATGLFTFIGAAPNTNWLPASILRDDKGFLLTGQDLRVNGELPSLWTEQRDPFLLETSVPGVFAAGDVRHGSVKRVASAVGEGSIAVQLMHQYLARY